MPPKQPQDRGKKRPYLATYIKFGFTCITEKGVEIPQCVICQKVFAVESMKPARFKEHFASKHPQLVDKDQSYFERHAERAKQQRLDATGAVHQLSDAATRASYMVAYEIAKNKKPHTIGETLILPCAKIMADLVIGPQSSNKLAKIPLSNNTVQRRISDIADDIEQQVVNEMQGLKFALQFDESTDVASCAQLICFTRYPNSKQFKEELLFITDLELTTKGEDVMNITDTYLQEKGLKWKNVCGVTIDGAPAMLGIRSGFAALIRRKNPNVIVNHCVLHRHALAARTLPESLLATLNIVVKTVNYVKSSDLNTRLFKSLCKDMDADHLTLLFHTKVRWLSRGNVLKRVYELRGEVYQFLENQKKEDLRAAWQEDEFEDKLAYLNDIFDELNHVNRDLQGKDTLIYESIDKLKAFVRKLENWERKIGQNGNIAMLSSLSELSENISVDMKTMITEHLQSLISEFTRYFPELATQEIRLIRSPFTTPVTVLPDDDDAVQTELLTLQEDTGAKIKYESELLTVFWCSMVESYEKLSDYVLCRLLPFATTYRCETAFSAMVTIKTKYRNRLNVAPDMRCALSITQPRIDMLVKKMQHHPSH